MAAPRGTALLLAVAVDITAGGIAGTHRAARAEPAGKGAETAPAQLRLRLPAICDPDHPQAGQDGMGNLLRRLFDGLGARQCGWHSSDPQWSKWAVTLWGGAMTEGDLGESLQLSRGFRSEYLGGIGVQRTIRHRRRIGLVVDANLLAHQAVDDPSNPGQTFGEGTIGLGLKVYPSRWLSFTVVEGLSLYTSRSRLQLERGGNGRQLVNYLAFEADAALGQRWSLVGRLHHRSGLFGALNCRTACDNNAYLLGLRYRFPPPTPPAAALAEQEEPVQENAPPPEAAPNRDSDEPAGPGPAADDKP